MASDKNLRDKDIHNGLRDPHTANLDMVPVIPLKNTVLFPGLNLPIGITEKELVPVVMEAAQTHTLLSCFTLKDDSCTGQFRKDYFEYGTLIEATQFIEDEKEGPGIIAHVLNIVKIKKSKFIDGVMYFTVEIIEEELPKEKKVFESVFNELKDTYTRMLSVIDDNTEPVVKMLESIKNPLVELSFMCLNSPVENAEKVKLLKNTDLIDRTFTLTSLINKSMDLFKVKKEIHDKTAANISEQQRQQFLRSQIQTMQEELGDTEDAELDELAMRADTKNWDKEVDEHFDKEFHKLERFNPSTPEYGILFSYLETMLELPWNDTTPDNYSINDVEKQLDTDHFGLKDVKERILEHIAVQKQRKDMKAPILCLYGPPGVGKTSLGKSIATAMGRGYSRISLGGVHDEAEIRGHRKTYIGAMPGRIIAAMRKMKGSNPLFMLDEIDKIEKDIKGDPSAALLELLDPEQNNKFHDNYLDIEYDLSKVMFIATANDISTVSRPLLDRMEIIRIDGYAVEEKIEIARRHLVPKALADNGFRKGEISFTEDAIKKIIENYTRESGVRGLEKRIAKVLRKIALLKAKKKDYPKTVSESDVRELLGIEDVVSEIYEGNSLAGVVTGLAWTSVGGEILYVETSLSRSNTPTLTLTGNLGNVMKESATLALQYLKANPQLLGLPDDIFTAYNVHIHVPEGAIPKDGPSAGITIATSIASAFTRRRVLSKVAMTGEITLRGKVLPVGGLKEKILAAKRAGITDIILSERNRKDIAEIEHDYIKDMRFHYVDTVADVLAKALTDEIDTTLPERTVPEKTKEKNN